MCQEINRSDQEQKQTLARQNIATWQRELVIFKKAGEPPEFLSHKMRPAVYIEVARCVLWRYLAGSLPLPFIIEKTRIHKQIARIAFNLRLQVHGPLWFHVMTG